LAAGDGIGVHWFDIAKNEMGKIRLEHLVGLVDLANDSTDWEVASQIAVVAVPVKQWLIHCHVIKLPSPSNNKYGSSQCSGGTPKTFHVVRAVVST